jgi:hypothetical protein
LQSENWGAGGTRLPSNLHFAIFTLQFAIGGGIAKCGSGELAEVKMQNAKFKVKNEVGIRWPCLLNP